MKKILLIALMLIFSCFGAIAAEEAIVISAIAPVLADASESAARVDEVIYGMTVTAVSSDVSGYSYISTAYGPSGYVNSSDLLISADAAANWKKSINYRVSSPQADIAQTPNTGSNSYKVGTVPKGTLLKVSGVSSTWGYTLAFPAPFVQTEGTSVGTVSGDRIIKTAAVRIANLNFNFETISQDVIAQITLRNSILSDALGYCDYEDAANNMNGDTRGKMAAPYRAGGRTHRGIDAEGLTSMVFMMNDITVKRSGMPLYPFKKISPAKAMIGDVIFWSGHQGIFAGDNKFIHADPRSRKVRIGSLDKNSPLYNADYDSAKILGWGSLFGTAITEAGDFISPDIKFTPKEGVLPVIAAEVRDIKKLAVAEVRDYVKIDPNTGLIVADAGKIIAKLGIGKNDLAVWMPVFESVIEKDKVGLVIYTISSSIGEKIAGSGKTKAESPFDSPKLIQAMKSTTEKYSSQAIKKALPPQKISMMPLI